MERGPRGSPGHHGSPIRQYGYEVGFEATPTFILYDAEGNEWQRWVGRAPSLAELQGLAP